MTVAIVTDSLADIPPALARHLEIRVVPLSVHFGNESYKDGVEMAADEFYKRLLQCEDLPTTSAPSPGDFVEAYRAALDSADSVLSVHASAKLSGTHNSALLGRQQFLDEWESKGGKGKAPEIRVVDTAWVSMSEGMMVIAAARAARSGVSLDDVEKTVLTLRSRTQCAILVDTLDYLVRGGRVGKAEGFIGSLLKVKPLLEIREGEVHPLERVRTFSKAYERLYEIAAAKGPIQTLAVVYNTTPQEANDLLARLKSLVPSGETYLSQIGPVVGTHAGPGTLAVMWVNQAR